MTIKLWYNDSSRHLALNILGCKTFPDVSDVVSKVRFFIHQTYAPNNVIDVTHPPYHLIRRGWGEFPARVQIHFKGAINKPVDIMHNIKVSQNVLFRFLTFQVNFSFCNKFQFYYIQYSVLCRFSSTKHIRAYRLLVRKLWLIFGYMKYKEKDLMNRVIVI